MSNLIVGSRLTSSTRSGVWNDPCSTGGRSDAQPARPSGRSAARAIRKALRTASMTASIRKAPRPRPSALRILAAASAAGLLFGTSMAAQDSMGARAADNVALQWDNALLEAVESAPPGPTVVSRSLAVLHTAIFDAWTAYDSAAVPTVQCRGWRRPPAERTEANKIQAINYAAYRAAVDLFPASKALFDGVMTQLGGDLTNNTTDPATP